MYTAILKAICHLHKTGRTKGKVKKRLIDKGQLGGKAACKITALFHFLNGTRTTDFFFLRGGEAGSADQKVTSSRLSQACD